MEQSESLHNNPRKWWLPYEIAAKKKVLSIIKTLNYMNFLFYLLFYLNFFIGIFLEILS